MIPKQIFSAYNHREADAEPRYRFCPMCGSALPSNSQHPENRPHCPECDWVHYRNPAPGVVILITEGDLVLLGRRAQSSFAAGAWCLPGGFIEYGENFLTAAVRETREETGLDVEICSIVSVVSNFLAAHLHTLVVVLRARILGGTAVPGDDIEELRWFPLHGPFPELAFEADRHIIERCLRTDLVGAAVDPEHARPPAAPAP
ncbi:nucleotide triphosphate diphosphatase NUDT15 [Geomesophilobacter sediminis]|uniref:NUDIX hydrolase n=1 Tax=Geomesophilobacter sediminis TaxID=2798584 RepID=A0A8J7LUZ2_9BACT|nr:NUDIX hydrolase [Geomesophilobacter sediminis]MBJ6724330.1 NUDIX hydrolase [Geomesophilobacter sediminis]